MGEAKRKQRALELWRATLSPDQIKVAEVSQALLDRFLLPMRSMGMCYRMTAFLTERLLAEAVALEPIVGYVNDGTDDVMISHAWIESNGRRTDLTLGITEVPDVQLPGEVIILDRIVRPGRRYSYHREMTEAGRRKWEEMRGDPTVRAAIEKKEEEHKKMSDVMRTSASRRHYLDAAPDGLTYERLAALVRQPAI